jgi:hypothetical protein
MINGQTNPKPNTKEYLRQHRGNKPWAIPDIGWMEQLVRYHDSMANQLRKEIKELEQREKIL